MVIQRVLASARVAPLPRNSSVHSSHSSVSLALDIFISPGGSEVQGNPSDSWGFMVDFHSRRLS